MTIKSQYVRYAPVACLLAVQRGRTVSLFAAMFNRTEIIDLLLAHVADSSLKTSDGMTALKLAEAMGAEAAAARLKSAND